MKIILNYLLLTFLPLVFFFDCNSSGQNIFKEQYGIIAISDNPSDPGYCSAHLQNNILIIENSKISRYYAWNHGNLITLTLTDKKSGKTWKSESSTPDMSIPGQTGEASDDKFTVRSIPQGPVIQSHLEAEIEYTLGELRVKRVFRIYPDCPAIASDLWFRGKAPDTWSLSVSEYLTRQKQSISTASYNALVLEKLEFPGRHWKLDAIEFFDVTDYNNNLVFPVSSITYSEKVFRGNLFFIRDLTSENGIFILKESPASGSQIGYTGYDLRAAFGTFRLTGPGIFPSDLDADEWKPAYSIVTGVYSGNERERLTALRDYQKRLRIHLNDRDEMILMNTWGDRSEASKISENFIIKELEAGARLGITHFQIDDGWQKGVTGGPEIQKNRLLNIWKTADYWKLNPEKFPNGLSPVMKRAGELGIEVCLWFNPARDNSNADWEKDADVLIGFYKKYGIRTFKIDGVMLPDKTAEINFRKMLDKIVTATDGNAVFNLDVTAGQRGGYHMFNEYGNLFLENRYTDFQSYYPYKTLRNLWMLSKYVPAQKLQIEFLNLWRNREKYSGDPFAPENYSFDYTFAITMMAQPLAWFEATGLPEVAFQTAPVIKKYRSLQSDIHSGLILPIGEEPCGSGWTGFQSSKGNSGYFLIFRENNNRSCADISTWLTPGTNVSFQPLLGTGKAFKAMSADEGRITFTLPSANSYCLYKYLIIKK